MKVLVLKLLLLNLLLSATLMNLFLSCQKTDYTHDTTIGIFSLFEPEILEELGAKSVRTILHDSQIKLVFEAVDSGTPLTDIDFFQKLISCNNKGIEVIITTRWPDPEDDHYDRVPLGEDRTDSLTLFSRFLNEIGPYISCLTLQNEVGGNGPGTYHETDMIEDAEGNIPAIEWFKEVTKLAREVISQNPSLSHLTIASPVPIALYAAVFNEDFATIDPVKAHFFNALIEFADQYTDALDIHLLKVALDEIDDIIDYVKSRTLIPIMCTEWSEVKPIKGWVQNDIDPSFKEEVSSTLNLESVVTNLDFINYCYDIPVTEEIWNKFVRTSPHDTTFMEEGFNLFRKEGFLYACWALGWQYEDPLFDMRTLFAQLTASGDKPKNEMIYYEFLNLTTKINGSTSLKEGTSIPRSVR